MCPDATVGAGDTRPYTCGAAASTPSTATAGATLPARWATFCTFDGVVCRPVLPAFLFLRCSGAALTNLPYAGSSPSYSATAPLTRPDSRSHRAAWQSSQPSTEESRQIAHLGYDQGKLRIWPGRRRAVPAALPTRPRAATNPTSPSCAEACCGRVRPAARRSRRRRMASHRGRARRPRRARRGRRGPPVWGSAAQAAAPHPGAQMPGSRRTSAPVRPAAARWWGCLVRLAAAR